MKVLVVGGTGILSTAVVEEAINKGFSLTMINRGRNSAMINKKAELLVGDINNTEQIETLLKNKHFDIVIDFLVWGKEQLSRSLSLFSSICDRYVFISSAQAYNTSVEGILSENSEMVQPLWEYSIHKFEAEQFLIDYCKNRKLKYTIIRPGVNYGDTRIPYGMYPAMGMHWTMIERIKSGKPIITWNNGLNKLNITHVDDFAKGVVGLLGNPNADNEVFNVVGDFVHTWKDVLTVVEKLTGYKVNTIDIPVTFYANELVGDTKESLLGGRSKDLVCSNEKLKKAVPGFCSDISLEEGVKRTLDFYQTHNYYRGFDYYYDGLCDYIIEKYCKTYGNKLVCSLRFINYGKKKGTALIADYLKYKKAFLKDSILIKVINKLR